jgi:hypothetical protein
MFLTFTAIAVVFLLIALDAMIGYDFIRTKELLNKSKRNIVLTVYYVIFLIFLLLAVLRMNRLI